jgi:hypothetical protein
MLITFVSGEHVQWFRTEAEMQRWQEQVEQKLAELLRTIWSFSKMKETWTDLSLRQDSHFPGRIAYAKDKASMYEMMETDCRKKLADTGYKHFVRATSGNMNKQKTRENLRNIYVINEYVHT